MQPSLSTVLTLVLSAIALGGQASAQRVWVVSRPCAGPGDFTDVQHAVDAASDGDVILVRPCEAYYGPFTIDAKSVTVLADGPDVAVQAFARVKNVPASGRVVLRGLSMSRLNAENCEGPLWIEECRFSSGFHSTISACACVVIVDSTFEQSYSIPFPLSTLVSSSSIYAYDSMFRGSDGFPDPSSPIQLDGGPGMAITDGTRVFASRCFFEGGDAAQGCDFSGCVTGSHGFAVANSADSIFWYLDSSFNAPIVSPAAAVQVPGFARSLGVDGVKREGETVALRFGGEPLDHVELLISSDLEATFTIPRGIVGPQLPRDPTLRVIDLGPLPPTGRLPKPHVIRNLPPGQQVLTLFLQPRMLGADGRLFLGAPSVFTILDDSF